MTVSATLKGSLDKFGRRRIYIRLADGNQRKFHATKLRIEPKYWDGKVINHDKAKHINDELRRLIYDYENGKQIIVDKSFHKYAIECIGDWETTRSPETIRQLYSKVSKFKSFADVTLGKISADLLNRYVNHCFSLGNTQNTVWSSLKVIRLIVLKAYREKLIAENPFVSFKMPTYKEGQRHYLTKAQVEEIEKFNDNSGEFKIAATWFLISCYTGLRYGDQRNFNKSKIKEGRLIIYTSKTGQVVSLKMNEKLTSLFKKISYKPLPYTNQHYNRLLAAIAVHCKIKDKITAHTSRHTFGTFCASSGISQETAARLMGHNSIRTTAIYYHITGSKLDAEYDKLF